MFHCIASSGTERSPEENYEDCVFTSHFVNGETATFCDTHRIDIQLQCHRRVNDSAPLAE